MPLPDDYLRPIWRGYMNGNGIGTLALDPREAEWVLEHGANLDGKRCRCLLVGDGKIDKTGRVMVRLEMLEVEQHSWEGYDLGLGQR